MTAWRVGIDIGGTFTDAALVDAETGQVRVVKVLTTPEDPAEGFMTALERGLAECGAGGRDVAAVVHATTVATNAIIEGKTARVGMLVTRGFRDILEIGRQIRSRLYDVHLQKPAPLVPRRWSLEVSERLDAEGRVLEPLDLGEVRAAVRRLRDERVEAVVICFLHSYLNPAHERAAAAIVREEMPDTWLSVSSEVCPEFREYLRGSTAAVNAAVMPIVSRYMDALESRLAALGATAPFYVMQSNGGVMTSASAKERPVYMVESGPAAGVIAAGAVAAPYRYANVLSFDMGGTTAKVGLIQDGRLRLSTEMEVGAQAVTPLGEGRGGGYPVRTPVIDLVEVGAGGGSEAWIDAGGALRVGPRSAGARPGPACYGLGGATPTITDANLVLGRLDPAFFLGGEMTLDADAARRAIAERRGRAPRPRSARRGQRHRGDRQRPHDRRDAPRLGAARLRSARVRARRLRRRRAAARQRAGARARHSHRAGAAEPGDRLGGGHARDRHPPRVRRHAPAAAGRARARDAGSALRRLRRGGRGASRTRRGAARRPAHAAKRRSSLSRPVVRAARDRPARAAVGRRHGRGCATSSTRCTSAPTATPRLMIPWSW